MFTYRIDQTDKLVKYPQFELPVTVQALRQTRLVRRSHAVARW